MSFQIIKIILKISYEIKVNVRFVAVMLRYATYISVNLDTQLKSQKSEEFDSDWAHYWKDPKLHSLFEPEGWRVNPEEDDHDGDSELVIGGKAEVTFVITKMETDSPDTRPQTVRFGIKSAN